MGHRLMWLRRGGLLVLLAIIIALAVSPAANARIVAHAAPEGAAWPEIHLVEIASGLEAPVDIASAGDGRLFIVEQAGRIRIVQPDGTLEPTPFLDISEKVIDGEERGLLGLVFHPDYEQNGYFYVNYTRDVGPDDDPATGDSIVARYSTHASGMTADPASETVLLAVDQPYSLYTHNGGDLLFGRDGYLYIALGDGGFANDPGDRAQSGQSLLGKILRIDVDRTSDALPYAIPEDNPFVDDPNVLDEIWALGLRNPWRMSFDRATGDLYIADVGQASREEVNFQPATSGGGENYGWRVMEGSECHNPNPCDPAGLVFPIAEYGREEGRAVVGGFVYRGGYYPTLYGYYFFTDNRTGSIWALKRDAKGTWLRSDPLADLNSPTTFGEGYGGELYVATYLEGRIYQLQGPEPHRGFLPQVWSGQQSVTD